MTAFNVVRFRVKPDGEVEFLEKTKVPGYEVKVGAAMRVGRQNGRAKLLPDWPVGQHGRDCSARPDMLADLDLLRPTLEDLGGGRGVTEAMSGEVIADHLPDK